MRIAVVGAGYAGLAVCWHLLKQASVEVTLFDRMGVASGASGVSTGLLHPYPGKRVALSKRGLEAFDAAEELIDIAQRESSHSLYHAPILRLAIQKEQEGIFTSHAENFQDRILRDEELSSLFPHLNASCALWIKKGRSVFSSLYLNSLWKVCERKGAKLCIESIVHPQELAHFDAAIWTIGSRSLELFPDAPLKTRKGQALLCKWPNPIEPLFCSLIGEGHLSVTEDPQYCLLGSTYEDHLNQQAALALRDKIGTFYPPAHFFEVVDIRSGVRISPKVGHLPCIFQHDKKTWVFTGLGSRGLLYHALYGKEVAEKVLTDHH